MHITIWFFKRIRRGNECLVILKGFSRVKQRDSEIAPANQAKRSGVRKLSGKESGNRFANPCRKRISKPERVRELSSGHLPRKFANPTSLGLVAGATSERSRKGSAGLSPDSRSNKVAQSARSHG